MVRGDPHIKRDSDGGKTTGRTVADSASREKENAKDTLCRNVTIYGHCRYEEKGGHIQIQSFRNQPADLVMKGVLSTTTQSSLRPPTIRWRSVQSQLPILAEMLCSCLSSVKKRFNVDSPSFTPASLTVNGASKTPGLSPKAANAAPFKPRNFSPGTFVFRRLIGC